MDHITFFHLSCGPSEVDEWHYLLSCVFVVVFCGRYLRLNELC